MDSMDWTPEPDLYLASIELGDENVKFSGP